MDKENNALVVKEEGSDNVNPGRWNISSDADTTSNKTDRDVNSLISTLSTLGEQISDTMTMDNELKALMERVRRAQILRVFGSINEKLPLDDKSTDTPTLSQKTTDFLLKEIGVQAEIKDMEAEADKEITKYKTLHEIVLSNNVVLTKEKENMQVKIAELKDEVLALKTAFHALDQKTSDYQEIKEELDFQKKAAEACLTRLCYILTYSDSFTNMTNRLKQYYDEYRTLLSNRTSKKKG